VRKYENRLIHMYEESDERRRKRGGRRVISGHQGWNSAQKLFLVDLRSLIWRERFCGEQAREFSLVHD